jgi:hypothetical protein
MEMKLIVYDRRDAITYMAPIITNACRDFASKVAPQGGGVYSQVTVDFNLTSFGYTINKVNPKTLITVMVDDSYHRPMIIVGVPFLRDDLFFKITFVNTNEDVKDYPEEWAFKLEYCSDRWGHNVIERRAVALSVSQLSAKFIELVELMERLVNFGTSNTFMTISMQDRCDAEEDVGEEADEEIPVEESDETPEEQPVHKMRRFAGMMPVNEIERTEIFKDKYGHDVRIDAGPNGWTVRYADMSSNYKDESIGTNANFKNAYDTAATCVGPLTPVKTERKEGIEK